MLLILERLMLPLPVADVRCECGALVDNRGCHLVSTFRPAAHEGSGAREDIGQNQQGEWDYCSLQSWT